MPSSWSREQAQAANEWFNSVWTPHVLEIANQYIESVGNTILLITINPGQRAPDTTRSITAEANSLSGLTLQNSEMILCSQIVEEVERLSRPRVVRLPHIFYRQGNRALKEQIDLRDVTAIIYYFRAIAGYDWSKAT